MGRQHDLERARQRRSSQPEEVATSLPRSPRVHRSPKRSRSLIRFRTLILLLISGAILVILTHRPPSSWSPGLLLTSAPSIDSSEPQPGDRILDLTVTQGWNSSHMGIDVALPRGQDSTGLPLYAIGSTGSDVEVMCWYEPIAGLNVSTHAEGMEFAFDYSHLNACITESRERTIVKAGQQIAEIGNTGTATTGPHLHFQQRKEGTVSPVTGEHVPGWKGYIELSLSGKTLSPSGVAEDAGTPEPSVLITPSEPSLRRPSPPSRSPQAPENFQEQPVPARPEASPQPEPPVEPPIESPSQVLRSPRVYPPI